jgi:hypothetical protein
MHDGKVVLRDDARFTTSQRRETPYGWSTAPPYGRSLMSVRHCPHRGLARLPIPERRADRFRENVEDASWLLNQEELR